METSSKERAEALWRKRVDMEHRWNLREGDEGDFHDLRSEIRATLATFVLKLFRLYERGRRNALTPGLTQLTFRYPNLPESLDGLSILHLSDFHFSINDTMFTEAIAKLVKGMDVDLCLMTGDYRYGHFGPQDKVQEHMHRVLSGFEARYGVFGVLGNHDLSEVVPQLRDLGVRVLLNEGVLLPVGNARVWIGGVDDPHKFRCDSLEDALAEAPLDAFKILLIHSPERVPEAVRYGVDLYLCGHTHGGQVCLPVIGMVYPNARCAPQYVKGVWKAGPMQGFTTRGLGTTDLPIRYHCPPEAALITLRRGDK